MRGGTSIGPGLGLDSLAGGGVPGNALRLASGAYLTLTSGAYLILRTP